MLRDWRNRKGLSQTELAGLLGVSAPRISQYETGLAPTLSIAAVIEDRTNGKVSFRDWIVSGEAKKGK